MLSILAVAIKEDRVINGSFLSDNPPGTEKKMPPSLSELLTLLFTLLPKPSSLHSASSLGHSQNLKFKKSDLEKEIEETNEEKKEIIAFGYNFAEEEFLSQGQYPSLPLDYVKMFYGENKKKPLAFESEDEYWTEAALADVENDMLTTVKQHRNYIKKCSSDEFFNNQIWRVSDVADYLKCSIKHIYNLTYRREIPFVKKGKFLFFIPTKIQNWILEGDLNEK